MSLPFLNEKRIGAVISAKQQPSGEVDRQEQPDDLQMIAEDLLRAIEMKDSQALVGALKAAFAVLDMGDSE